MLNRLICLLLGHKGNLFGEAWCLTNPDDTSAEAVDLIFHADTERIRFTVRLCKRCGAVYSPTKTLKVEPQPSLTFTVDGPPLPDDAGLDERSET